jgi:hypothetical protein
MLVCALPQGRAEVGLFEGWCRLRDSNTRPHHYESSYSCRIKIGFSVAYRLNRCRRVGAPKDSPKRLRASRRPHSDQSALAWVWPRIGPPLDPRSCRLPSYYPRCRPGVSEPCRAISIEQNAASRPSKSCPIHDSGDLGAPRRRARSSGAPNNVCAPHSGTGDVQSGD